MEFSLPVGISNKLNYIPNNTEKLLETECNGATKINLTPEEITKVMSHDETVDHEHGKDIVGDIMGWQFAS